MGLDTSHDAFHGAYSAFNRFRQVVAKAAGGSYPPHDDSSLDRNTWYWGEGRTQDTCPGLWEFLSHSDCDGEIPPEKCKQVADELEMLLPRIAETAPQEDAGHIASQGGYVAVTRRFIEGCRRAHAADEPLDFH